MNPGRIAEGLRTARTLGRSLLYVLVDPDKQPVESLPHFAAAAEEAGVDGLLVGGSLSMSHVFDAAIRALKSRTTLPVVLFPGGIHQISGAADALLFLSVISGRNADQLIGQHVVAAPIVRSLGLEAISTGYMLIESGAVTSAEFMSYSKPIPRNKPDIAAAHAMAAEYLGMHCVYLEAGSGAPRTVPDEMIAMTASLVSCPVFVGGGIRTPEDAASKVRAGATVVVIGTHFEREGSGTDLVHFAAAVHSGH